MSIFLSSELRSTGREVVLGFNYTTAIGTLRSLGSSADNYILTGGPWGSQRLRRFLLHAAQSKLQRIALTVRDDDAKDGSVKKIVIVRPIVGNLRS